MNKIDISSWREFKVGDLFPVIIKPSVIHAKSVIESKSGIPYVVRSKFNNGIKCRVEKSVDFKPSPAGTISFGAENASFFYQAEEYISGRDIYYLDTRNLSKHACFFLIACLQSLTHKYSYNYGLFPDLLKKEYIKLPATADGKPDWQYMEQYISNKEKQVTQWLDTLQNISHLVGGGNALIISIGENISLEIFSISAMVKESHNMRFISILAVCRQFKAEQNTMAA